MVVGTYPAELILALLLRHRSPQAHTGRNINTDQSINCHFGRISTQHATTLATSERNATQYIKRDRTDLQLYL
jgi:hypothetical protein